MSESDMLHCGSKLAVKSTPWIDNQHLGVSVREGFNKGNDRLNVLVFI